MLRGCELNTELVLVECLLGRCQGMRALRRAMWQLCLTWLVGAVAGWCRQRLTPSRTPCFPPQAVALTSGVEHRLSSKLKRTAERQAAAGGGGSGYQHHHQHPGASKHAALLQHGRHHAGGRGQGLAAAGQQQQQQQAAEGGEDDDSEEEGRGGAFSKGKGKGAARPATYSRSDLLLAGPTGQGKKRKRKGGQGGSGAAGS